ncbi:YtxH domain-containing protein [Cellulomonas sp. ATA003]|uniref:YtxH domain-containing protein n=1 Tax=Cellulomonas sp. ATA003 TaxID=3073064 RepID=UPI0028736C4E|nr:YtxH domain-containing protein [Cellulomonas sp. ATA003]WNB85510.1 YtxH domain-containing protein [Cellulomonas sp. ATA003]
MGSKAAFIAGTGLGYVLGTRAGRQRFDTIKGWTATAWSNPRVQAGVTELKGRAADLARSEAQAIKGRVTESVRTSLGSARGLAPAEPVGTVPVSPGAPVVPGTAAGNGTPSSTV